jgi:outer membrane protein assembly factor BamB
MRSLLPCGLLTLLAAPVLLHAGGQADRWPQFRGPGSAGVSTQPGLPQQWDQKKNVAWEADVPGRGWSSPIVWGDRVFVTAVLNEFTPKPRPGLYIQDNQGKIPKGEHRWVVYCLDFNTGKILWQRTAAEGTPGGPIHLKNTYASETPVTDGERIYAYFGNKGLYCYDLDGKLLWSKCWGSYPMRYGWGTAASPTLHKDRIYVVNDNEESSFLIALDKRTGEEVWKVTRDEKSNWSTPFVWENELRTEIVTAGSGKVRSYDLDGKLLWELKGMSSITIPTPLSGHGLLYVGSGYILDGLRPLYAIKPGASGDISLKQGETSNAWIAWYQKGGSAYHASPLVYGDYVYILYDMGFLSCFEARTGKPVYVKERINPGSDKFTASPWAYDGKIFCLSEDGDTFVIAAGLKFQVLAKNSLDDMCLATPALARDSVILRTASKLYRIRDAIKKTKPPNSDSRQPTCRSAAPLLLRRW